MMAAPTLDELEAVFDDHPSLSASLEDFEHDNRSPLFGIPSHHSGFKSEDSEPGSDRGSDSPGPWDPPAWRRQFGSRSSWFAHQPYQQEPLERKSASPVRGSREPSPEYEDAQEGDVTAAANVRLPTDSPKKRSPSPNPYPTGTEEFGNTFGGQEAEHAVVVAENPNNYIRFAVRAEVQHRTEPFEAAFSWVRQKFDAMTKSRQSTLFATVVAFLSFTLIRFLVQPPLPPPAPDLVKVAGLAKSFEPLIFYSENGVRQVGDLQETGVAVWDLSESIRSTNMTSAPIIVKELDDLSEGLKTLSIELTRFFANVDGDIDGILIVMEWAKRELTNVLSAPSTSISALASNLHLLACRIGVLEHPTTGKPTPLGSIFISLFGATTPQRTRATLHRTFNEFLSVLEESITTELSYSTALFALFESIDRQFHNLARSVTREFSAQEREEGELLSSLWTRVLGTNAAQLRKYERNRALLLNIREKTIRNKHILVEHNGRLLSLKASLENLRQKLVSPLVRRNDSSTLTVEEQIRGLDGTYDYLRGVRERQRERLLEMIYGAGDRRRVNIVQEVEGSLHGARELEAR